MLRRFPILLFTLLGAFAMPALAQTQTQPSRPNTCTQFMPLGKLYYGQGLIDQAYLAFRSCVVLEPRNTEALHALARTETRLKLFSAAVEHLKTCIGTDAKYWRCYVTLADTYRLQWRGSSDRSKLQALLDEALKVLDDADRVATTNEAKAAIANARGTIYKDRGDIQKAIDNFERAVALSPNEVNPMFNLGALYFSANKLSKAVEVLKRAVNLAPQDAEVRAYLARSYRERNEKGDLDLASDQATQAYNLCGASKCKNSFVIGQYGTVLFVQNNLNLARPILEQAVKADTSNIYHENFYNLGRVYMQLGRAKDAKFQFSKAVLLDVENQLYWFWLGQANEANGEKDEACKAYAKAVTIAGGAGQYKEAEKATTALKCPAPK